MQFTVQRNSKWYNAYEVISVDASILDYYSDSKTKRRTRCNILDTAEKLMSEKGINQVAMKDISEAANIDRKTLYRYYDSKEDIVVDVGYSIVREMVNLMETFKIGSGTGYDNLCSYLDFYYEKIIMPKQDAFMFLIDFDNYIAGLGDENKALNRYRVMIEEEKKDQNIRKILRQGIEDGSIDAELDRISETSETIIQSVISVTMRVYLKEHERDVFNPGLIKDLIKIILNGMKKC